jgi:general L-amino acid transport system permease protein
MATTTDTFRKVLPPPSERSTILGWLRKNLFSTWYNGLLTVVSLMVALLATRSLINWALNQARWEVIVNNLRLFMIGQYPIEQAWRVWISLFILAAVIGLSWGTTVRGYRGVAAVLIMGPLLLAILPFSLQNRLNMVGLVIVGVVTYWAGRNWKEHLRRFSLISWLIYFPLLLLIIRGLTGDEGFMPLVETRLWGGLLLTLLLAVIGIVFAFPIGVALALGRRSELPVIRWVSTIYIEFVRGVPLITILFTLNLMLPLFLPEGLRPESILRAMVAITMFSAAYMAENIRGGLQAIPTGQYEAAHAIGLSGFHTTTFIILPQALRTVIPVLVGQFIGLAKDTTLVAILGLFDILGIGRSVLGNPEYIGTSREVYIFVAAVFFVFSYAMSYASRRLEVALGVGER